MILFYIPEDKPEFRLRKAYKGDVGYDIVLCDDTPFSEIVIPPGEIEEVHTGLYLRHCPEGTFLKIEPRSGLARRGITVLGGIIDPSYRGEIIVILTNLGQETVHIKPGQAIAQLIPYKYDTSLVVEITPDGTTKVLEGSGERGERGFGSSDG